MVFFEAVYALLNLDFAFFVNIIASNIMWVFIWFCVVFFLFDGKKTIYFFVLFSILFWAFFDFGGLTGLTFISATFLLLNYLSKLSVIAWAENTPALKNNLIMVSETLFFTLLLVYTFFLS